MSRRQGDVVSNVTDEHPGHTVGSDASTALVVTSQAATAARLAGALGLAGTDLRVVTARSGIEGIHLATGRAPIELLVIDRALPGLTGAVVTRAIRALHPRVRVVILVPATDDDAIVEALGAGADAIFVRTDEPTEFPRLVQRVRRGEPLAQNLLLERPGVAARVVELVQARTSLEAVGAPNLRGLTARELAVVDGVVQGLSNREIGERLQLTEQTVKNHMTSVLRKLRLHDRLHVLRLATQEGWAQLGNDGSGNAPDPRATTAG